VIYSDPRVALADDWLKGQLNEAFRILPLADDASFRRYFRVVMGERTLVLMDAPPGKEDIQPFMSVRSWMAGAGLHVPELLFADLQQGFLLLEDLGDRTWARFLQAGGDVNQLMPDAMRQLHALRSSHVSYLKPFDMARMHLEFDLYLDWYLPKVAGVRLSEAQKARFHQAIEPLLQQINSLPKVPVHLDFHSRNLMVLFDNQRLGVIDFQDAVQGPLTYDLASLLYDCYQNYPEDQRSVLSRAFFAAMDTGWQAHFDDAGQWHRLLRLTAMQRHIKAIGIFSRLAYRDGKTHFLDEIPLTRKHLLEAMPLFDIPPDLAQLLSIPPQ